jgi:membrane protein
MTALLKLLKISLNLPQRQMLFLRQINLAVLVETMRRIGEHRLLGLSAEIAYYAIFALFPAILAILTAIGLLNLPASEFHRFIRQLDGIIPNEAMTLIQGFLKQLRNGQSQGLFSLSFLASIWVSSNVMGAVMAAIDQIQRIPRPQQRSFWRAKVVAIGLSLGTFLLLITALTFVFISSLSVKVVAQHSGMVTHNSVSLGIWPWLSLPTALAIVTLTLSFIYRYGSSTWRSMTPILPGAVLATMLWAFLSGVLRLYIAHFANYNQAYGAIGAVIILLLWLYLSAFSMLLGSQLNAVIGEALVENGLATTPSRRSSQTTANKKRPQQRQRRSDRRRQRRQQP